MSSYFSLPSFARAKKNREELERSNPQNPVLKEEDERFLERQISHHDAPEEVKDEVPTKITDEGEEKEPTPEEKQQAGADQVAVPEEQPQTGDGVQESRQDEVKSPSVEDPPEEAPDDSAERVKAAVAYGKKAGKKKGFDLPSQEEAEAATKNFKYDTPDQSGQSGSQTAEKRSWASYIPSMGYGSKRSDTDADKPAAEAKEGEQQQSQGQQRTWGEYASAAYSSLPSMPSLPTWTSKDKDGKVEPVYNEDGTVNEEKTKEKQEREVSVLLDNLDMSNINNRVFSFSNETQKIYARFSEILRDTMNGGPTAYEDMEKLMREAGPQLEKQFASMPPFVQTLVKSLPAKLGTTLGPELMAAASEKPGADMQARMKEASEKRGEPSGDPDLSAPSSSEQGPEDGQKKKRKIPGMKSLVSEQGAVASILRNVVNFLQTRFPFLASTTNVVMSLAVFILMFVFWYCHKRGREVRLANEAGAGKEGQTPEEGGSVEVSDVDDSEGEEEENTTETAKSAQAASEEAGTATHDTLNQPEPSQVPLPDTRKGEKGAGLEAEKATGA